MKRFISFLLLALAPLLPATPAAPQAEATQVLRIQLGDELPIWTDLSPEQGLSEIDACLAQIKEVMLQIGKLSPEAMNWENTFGVLAHWDANFGSCGNLISNMASCSGDARYQIALEKAMQKSTEFLSWFANNRELYDNLHIAAQQPWVEQLSPEQKCYITSIFQDYARLGADLPTDKRARIAKLDEELNELCARFVHNTNGSAGENELLFVKREDLDGMSEEWLAQAQEDASRYGSSESNPMWVVGRYIGSLSEVLTNCHVEKTRRQCWYRANEFCARGSYNNTYVLAQILKKRQEYAELMGFDNYAAYEMDSRMVTDCQVIRDFLEARRQQLKPTWERELKELRDYISQKTGKECLLIKPWDIAYYRKQMQGEHHQFDEAEVRCYYHIDHVLREMFRELGQCFGVVIKEQPTHCPSKGQETEAGKVNVWHKGVRFFDIYDAQSHRRLGQFYLDPYTRVNKRGGAWTYQLRLSNKAHPHALCTLICNIDAAQKGQLDMQDITTLFHEFGHVLHLSLGEQELRALSATGSSMDFVEMPSQMMERWVWERELLQKMSCHKDSGEPIPDELLDKLLENRHFQEAMTAMGVLADCKIDFEAHARYREEFENSDIDRATWKCLAGWLPPLSAKEKSVMRYLTHSISGGYAAGYYSYSWAEVLAVDAYSRFKESGADKVEVGRRFRKEIFAPGGTRPEMESMRAFLGREPNLDAMEQE